MARWYTANPIAFYDDTLFPPQAGAVAITDAQHTAMMAAQQAGSTIVADGAGGLALKAAAPPLSPPNAAQLAAAAALAGGITITSTSTPALNGTYDCSAATISHIQSEVLSIIISKAFADGSQTVDWPDQAGATHTFPSTDVFQGFAVACAAFVAGCSKAAFGKVAVPLSQVTIP